MIHKDISNILKFFSASQSVAESVASFASLFYTLHEVYAMLITKTKLDKLSTF